MGQKSKKSVLGIGPEFDDRRIKLAARRCHEVLSSALAQDDRCIKMGMEFNLNIITENGVMVGIKDFDLSSSLPNVDSIDAVATRVRVFMLRNENLYWKKVLDSLRRKDQKRKYERQIESLAGLFSIVPFSRMEFSKVNTETGEELIPGWLDNAFIGDRYAYSKVFHADDEIDLLDEFENSELLFAYASFVGDMLAMVAALESCIHLVCPENCKELTSWAGNPRIINYRAGLDRELNN